MKLAWQFIFQKKKVSYLFLLIILGVVFAPKVVMGQVMGQVENFGGAVFDLMEHDSEAEITIKDDFTTIASGRVEFFNYFNQYMGGESFEEDSVRVSIPTDASKLVVYVWVTTGITDWAGRGIKVDIYNSASLDTRTIRKAYVGGNGNIVVSGIKEGSATSIYLSSQFQGPPIDVQDLYFWGLQEVDGCLICFSMSDVYKFIKDELPNQNFIDPSQLDSLVEAQNIRVKFGCASCGGSNAKKGQYNWFDDPDGEYTVQDPCSGSEFWQINIRTTEHQKPAPIIDNNYRGDSPKYFGFTKRWLIEGLYNRYSSTVKDGRIIDGMAPTVGEHHRAETAGYYRTIITLDYIGPAAYKHRWEGEGEANANAHCGAFRSNEGTITKESTFAGAKAGSIARLKGNLLRAHNKDECQSGNTIEFSAGWPPSVSKDIDFSTHPGYEDTEGTGVEPHKTDRRRSANEIIEIVVIHDGATLAEAHQPIHVSTIWPTPDYGDVVNFGMASSWQRTEFWVKGYFPNNSGECYPEIKLDLNDSVIPPNYKLEITDQSDKTLSDSDYPSWPEQLDDGTFGDGKKSYSGPQDGEGN